MTDQPKATEVLDPQLEKIKWGLEETLRARDAEIRELKAEKEYLASALDQMLGQFDDYEVRVPLSDDSYIAFKWDGYGIDGHFCKDAPELTNYLCELNGWPNPLEGGGPWLTLTPEANPLEGGEG